METISIILPIYNVGDYLPQCLDSLLYQNYPQVEIILVNDGSKDDSLAICQMYAAKDSRVVVIDKENEGVAIARNVGMEAATGKYIAFVDPDDWVEPEMYASLITQLEKWDAPICLCNYYKDTKRKSQPKFFEFEGECLEDEEITEKLINDMVGMPDLLPKYGMVMGSVWRGLYKRSFIEQNHLKFVPKLSIMEDLVFMVQVLLKCHKVAIDPGVWYHYVQHASSALHSYNHQLWEDQVVVYEHLERSLQEANLEAEMRNRLDFRYIGMVLTAIKNETYMKKDGDFKDTITRIKEIFTDDTLRCVLERVKPIQVEKSPEKIEKEKKEKIPKPKKTKLKKTQKAKEERKAKKEQKAREIFKAKEEQIAKEIFKVKEDQTGKEVFIAKEDQINKEIFAVKEEPKAKKSSKLKVKQKKEEAQSKKAKAAKKKKAESLKSKRKTHSTSLYKESKDRYNE